SHHHGAWGPSYTAVRPGAAPSHRCAPRCATCQGSRRGRRTGSGHALGAPCRNHCGCAKRTHGTRPLALRVAHPGRSSTAPVSHAKRCEGRAGAAVAIGLGMRPHLVIAMSSASEPLLSACKSYPSETRPASCQDATAHMFDYSDEELSRIVEWASIERTAL